MPSAISMKIDNKRKELQNLRDIRDSTRALANYLEEIAQKLQTMNDGAECVTLVLSNWKTVTSSVSLASLGLARHAQGLTDAPQPEVETLIRAQLEDTAQSSESNTED